MKRPIQRSTLFFPFLMITLLWGLLVSACSSRPVSFAVPAGEGTKAVALEATSFNFTPNEIEARVGDRLLLEVHNTAGLEHNLTVEDPDGKVIINVDLPAGQTLPVELLMERAGRYNFYCHKPLHASFGMSGTITAR